MSDDRPVSALALVVGPAGTGKSSLLRRLADTVFPVDTPRTIGLSDDAFVVSFLPSDDTLPEELRGLLPEAGFKLEFMEVAGREAHTRDVPRGRGPRGLLLCYDSTDRTSFLRCATVLCKHRLDWHLADSKAESWAKTPGGPPASPRLASVLCSMKADLLTEVGAQLAATASEVREFVEHNGMSGAVKVSAKTNVGVTDAVQMIAVAILRASRQDAVARTAAATADWAPLTPAAEAWSLPCCERLPTAGPMTSPRGDRPHEPLRPQLKCGDPRGQPRLVEVLDSDGATVCAPRTLERCLERGLLHRTVHLWLRLPRAGGLLLRRRAPGDPKDPSRWGSTAHGEVLCYGSGGDGHAAELAKQAVLRCLEEQLGLKEEDVGELQHCFSTRNSRLLPGGCCKEFIDVFAAPIKGKGLPPVNLHPDEDLEWAYFGDVLGEAAREAGTIFYMEAEYRKSFARELQAAIVQADMENAFGKGVNARLESCRPKEQMTMVLT